MNILSSPDSLEDHHEFTIGKVEVPPVTVFRRFCYSRKYLSRQLVSLSTLQMTFNVKIDKVEEDVKSFHLCKENLIA